MTAERPSIAAVAARAADASPRGDALEPTPVIEVLASGPAKGGGIGQMVRFLMQENAQEPALVARAFVDPRGPGRWIGTLWRLPAALAHLVRLRLGAGAGAVLHIHLAGRLSTLRKAVMIWGGRALGFPCVAHYHEYGFATFLAGLPAPLRALTALTLRQCAWHIVLGPGEAQALPALLKVDPARFAVIPNGVPEALTRRPRAPHAETTDIVFVGALSERKGVSDLLRAAARLPSALPWRLVFCGGGDIAARRAEAAALGLGDRCTFLGQTDNAQVQGVLRSSRVFVLPSYAEGLAVALLEAMAAGCAVIATPVGEQGLALRDGENALVVRPGDVAGLAGALERLLLDAGLAARLGAAAQADVAARFSTRIVLQRCAQVLRAAQGERRGARAQRPINPSIKPRL